jgi:hypothetical protein
VALDLDAGTLHASFDGGNWISASPIAMPAAGPCRPSASAGAALYPVLWVGSRAWLRCNWGADPKRPLKHGPPSVEYRAVGLMRGVNIPPSFPQSAHALSTFLSCDALPPRHVLTLLCCRALMDRAGRGARR